jgi:hypothetical protein
MEFSKVELKLALKFPDGSDAEKTLLKLKLEMLAKRGDRLLREIRERAEKSAPSKPPNQSHSTEAQARRKKPPTPPKQITSNKDSYPKIHPLNF